MESVWQATSELPRFPQLEGDQKTDVLIIGGGMAGLLCAHALQKAGVEYLLAESDTIAGGVTGFTTAKITALQGLIYSKVGDRAFGYYQANRDAVRSYRQLCSQISCDYVQQDAWTFSRTDSRRLEREARALQQLGAPVEFHTTAQLPFPVVGAIRLSQQAQFHPLKFLGAICQGLHIYEHTPVTALEGTTAQTPLGKIHAQRVVIATHFPILNSHGSYFMKMYQHRSYVLALEGAGEVPGMYVEDRKSGLSLRMQGQLLLLGGGGHRTGKPGGGWEELRSLARQYYPQAREVYHWATQDCVTLDGLPYIGPYSASTKNLYVATGFNKWGMTGAMVAANVLTQLLQGRESPYGDAFSPSRSMLRPQLAANGVHALTGWLTPSGRRCPHMGCALQWNPQERTWDCPCHGSRFTQKGTLLENPAVENLPRKGR